MGDLVFHGMKVDAFVLNAAIFSDDYYIAPLNRPDYSSLNPGRGNLKHDFIPPVELSTAHPWNVNSRIADLPKGEVRPSRRGIYLHWCIPKQFRAGKATVDAAQPTVADALPSDPAQTPRKAKIEYSNIPDRWIIIRHIHSVEPPKGSEDLPTTSAFLVENNQVRTLDSFGKEDHETSASPFLDRSLRTEDQIQTLLGRVISSGDLTATWDPTVGASAPLPGSPTAGTPRYHTPLQLLDTGNPLFADYVPHNAGVFSLQDDLTWKGSAPESVQSATISYIVYGFFASDFLALRAVQDNQPLGRPCPVCVGLLMNVEYHRDQRPSAIRAEEKAKYFSQQQPVAIGNGVLDSLTTLLGASAEQVDVSMASALQLASGAIATPDTNSQLDRADAAVNNFKASPGGYKWRMATKGEKRAGLETLVPGQDDQPLLTPAQEEALRLLNANQAYLDTLYRRNRYVKHLIFCEWWKHRSFWGDADNLTKHRRFQARQRARRLVRQLKMINELISGAEASVKRIHDADISQGPFSKEKGSFFFSHDDPVVTLKDMGSGWPQGWADKPITWTKAEYDLFFKRDNASTLGYARAFWDQMTDEYRAKICNSTTEAWYTRNMSGMQKMLPYTFKNILYQDNMAVWTQNDRVQPPKIPALMDWYQQQTGIKRIDVTKQAQFQFLNLPRQINDGLSVAVCDFFWKVRGILKDKFPTPLPTIEEQLWSGQPWRPLFLEWEVEYAHIPLEFWEFRHYDDGTVNYGIKNGLDASKSTIGTRTLAGRSLLMPEASGLIWGMMETLFNQIQSETLNSALPEDSRKKLENYLKQQQISFAKLDGITDHLLTLCQGAHAIPTLHEVQHQPVLDPAAKERGFRKTLEGLDPEDSIFKDESEVLLLVRDENSAPENAGGLDVTPYVNHSDGMLHTPVPPSKRRDPNQKDHLFRPVTHGQLRFKKLNIVDRFAQVISAFDPRQQPPKPFNPIISSGLLCEPLSQNETDAKAQPTPNTAQKLSSTDLERGDCPWWQVAPRINQDARLNAAFLVKDEKSGSVSGYRPVRVGENAIFAWLIVNYHDRSIQVYDEDGKFVGEAFLPARGETKVYWQTITSSGHSKDVFNLSHLGEDHPAEQAAAESNKTVNWMPMTLDDLISSLSSASFVHNMWIVLTNALENMNYPSRQYTTVPSAFIGTPLALTNLGLGLELATTPMHSQAYDDYFDPETLDSSGDPDDEGRDTERDLDLSETTNQEELTSYKFGVKLGDMLGTGDGLVGYFGQNVKTSETQPPKWTFVTDYIPRGKQTGRANTFNVSHQTDVNGITVSPEYPKLLPFQMTSKHTIPDIAEQVDNYTRAMVNTYKQILTVLADPFLTISIRTAILPVINVHLNRFALERDMKRLGVWLKAGPILIGARSEDPVAAAQKVDENASSGSVKITDANAAAPKGSRVPIQTPPGGECVWKWVQPMLAAPKDPDITQTSDIPGELVADLESKDDSRVEYRRFDVMPPVKSGFDASVSSQTSSGTNVDTGIATVLEGFLISEPI